MLTIFRHHLTFLCTLSHLITQETYAASPTSISFRRHSDCIREKVYKMFLVQWLSLVVVIGVFALVNTERVLCVGLIVSRDTQCNKGRLQIWNQVT